MVDASPLPGTDAFAEFGGATINIYTTEESEDGALAIAAREVAEAGWQIQSVEDNFVLTREDLVETSDGLQYFDQAMIDGIVLVVYTYPATAEDRDAIH